MRLFVALDPPPSFGSALDEALREIRPIAPQERWSPVEKLHLTLAFLGHRPGDLVAIIREALSPAVARHAPFSIRVAGAGTFGRGQRARVLWLGVDGGEALSGLQSSVVSALEAIDYHEERPFKAHLTLARARDPRGSRALASAREALATLDLGSFSVREILLYQSELSPRGAHYTRLAAFPLGR